MAYTTIYAAFMTAYADMTHPKKNAFNGGFKNKYANLEELINVTRPHLVANGLALVQQPVNGEGTIGVHTKLLHTSGESLDFGAYTVPLAKHDAQGAGSAITYCRRYAIAAIFGLVQEDDDGNAAARPQAVAKPAAAPAAKPADKATAPMLHTIAGLMKSLSYDAADAATISTELFGQAISSKELTQAQATKFAEKLAAIANERDAKTVADLGAEEVPY